MKRITMSFAAALQHTPKHPERTGYRNGLGSNFDVTFKEWPTREALARSIRIQERREHRQDDWRPFLPLRTTEGY